MKFINYGIPNGLGIKSYESNPHNYKVFDGITSNLAINENEVSLSSNLQVGGDHYNTEPCETVFYIFDHKPFINNEDKHEDNIEDKLENNLEDKLEDIEEINNQDIEEDIEEDKLGDNEEDNEENEEDNKDRALKRTKIRTLEGLFPGLEKGNISDTKSHDSLLSILKVLKQSTR